MKKHDKQSNLSDQSCTCAQHKSSLCSVSHADVYNTWVYSTGKAVTVYTETVAMLASSDLQYQFPPLEYTLLWNQWIHEVTTITEWLALCQSRPYLVYWSYSIPYWDTQAIASSAAKESWNCRKSRDTCGKATGNQKEAAYPARCHGKYPLYAVDCCIVTM